MDENRNNPYYSFQFKCFKGVSDGLTNIDDAL